MVEMIGKIVYWCRSDIYIADNNTENLINLDDKLMGYVGKKIKITIEELE